MSRTSKFVTALMAAVLCVTGWNYFGTTFPVSRRLAEDSRNKSVSLWAYHQYGVMPSTLVIDLRDVTDEAAPLDVMRALLHSADGLKESKFARVILARRGSARFMLDGEYFQTLGQEFRTQNPMYTLRTMPQHVFKLDGTPAYGTWTGGALGVLTRQLEDLTRFSQEWVLQR